ncbi:hypothetical protein GUI12_02520 [Anaplasmataceae bacterium AB001_6]|nr:hypothetical protein GUI12_02520 [Anaplasmataceae bacterium AB001_6]
MQSIDSDFVSDFVGKKSTSFGKINKLKPVAKFTWVIVFLFICNTAILTAVYSSGHKSSLFIEEDDLITDQSELKFDKLRDFDNSVPLDG